MEGFGAQAQAVEQLPRSAVAAGLEVVSLDGSFAVASPDRMFAIHAATLAAARERATTAGLANEDAIDGLIGELRAAATGGTNGSRHRSSDITMRADRGIPVGADGLPLMFVALAYPCRTHASAERAVESRFAGQRHHLLVDSVARA
jgi:hypothetical protein